MAPSPWPRRRKPRHARPRQLRFTRPCPWCVHGTLDAAATGTGQLLIVQPPAHWQPVLLAVCLLLVHGALRPCPHTAADPATPHEQISDR
ncbi:hypothetical protein [Streptomyces sp. NPDC017941]|uniref:hypothetical protein n=1 Tax=Streptomyces sp. NPDC017941 TaxID=3365018 RepID=UPI0037AD6691